MTVDLAIRPFLRRILGYSDASAIAVDRAERSLQLAASRHATLVLCGEGDLVPIAAALRRRTLSTNAPFIVCDPRRGNTTATVRSPANRATGIDAIAAARNGTLCILAKRLPGDFSSLIERVRDSNAQTIVCWRERDDKHPLLLIPSPIVIPHLRDRAQELPNVVEEYAGDALAELITPVECFTEADRAWVLAHAASSLAEIEKATLRRVALCGSRNVSTAAARLKMAPVSLARWLQRRAEKAQLYR